MPIGAIGDRWGRKPVLVSGLVLFAAANLASAFVTSPEPLIALRVLAGLAAAMIMPVTLSVITTSFPAHERVKAIGTWAGVAGAGGILGLFASAAIIDLPLARRVGLSDLASSDLQEDPHFVSGDNTRGRRLAIRT